MWNPSDDGPTSLLPPKTPLTLPDWLKTRLDLDFFRAQLGHGEKAAVPHLALHGGYGVFQ